MKPQANIARLLGLAETAGQPVAGRIHQGKPVRLLKELDQKLSILIERHRVEIERLSRPRRRKPSRKI